MISLDTPVAPVRKLERFKPHQKYYVDGLQVPGGSTISKIGVSTYGLDKWKDNCKAQGIDPDQVRDTAAVTGDIVHFRIQAEIEGFEPDFDDYTDEEVAASWGPFQQAMAWWNKQDLTLVAAEQQMVSKMYLFGGTADMICRDGDGALVLLDWKTSSQIRPEHRYQIAGYDQLVEENMNERVIKRAVARVSRDGRKVQRNPWISDDGIEAYWAVFQSQLRLYYAMQEAAE